MARAPGRYTAAQFALAMLAAEDADRFIDIRLLLDVAMLRAWQVAPAGCSVSLVENPASPGRGQLSAAVLLEQSLAPNMPVTTAHLGNHHERWAHTVARCPSLTGLYAWFRDTLARS